MDKFRLNVSPKDLVVDPGGQVNLTLTIRNLSDIVDQYRVEIVGVEQSWFRLSVQSVSLFPQDQDHVSIIMAPPRAPFSRAGTYQVTAKVSSREFKEEVTVQVVLQVGPYFAYTPALAPQQQTTRSAGQFNLSLDNKGNVPAAFSLAAEDPERECSFDFQPPAPTVPPGETGSVPLRVEPKKRRLIGAPVPYPFTISVTPHGYEDQARTLNGQLTYRPLIPTWVPPAVLALLGLLMVVLLRLLGQGPVIEKFAADRDAITLGENVELSWRVRNAHSVRIQPEVVKQPLEPGGGTLKVQLASRGQQKFTLVAQRGSRIAEQAIAVTVRFPPPEIVLFKTSEEPHGDPQRPDLGYTIALKWKTRNCTRVKIEPQPGTVALDGGIYVPYIPDQTLTYKLTCGNPDHPDPVDRSVVVGKPPKVPVVTRFDAQPPEIDRGQQAVLTWEAVEAETIVVEGIGPVSAPSGSTIVAPAQTTTYVLRASNKRGTASPRPVMVRVRQAPGATGSAQLPSSGQSTPPPAQSPPPLKKPALIRRFMATRSQITAGESTRLCWSAANAASLQIEPEVGEVEPEGCRDVSPSQTTTYKLTATGGDGRAIARPFTVRVRPGATAAPGPLVVRRFDVDKPEITAGESTKLCWAVINATSVRIEPEVGEVEPGDGCRDVAPPQTTTYRLIANREGGPSTTRPLTVRVRTIVTPTPSQPAQVRRFAPEKSTIRPGETTQLCWSIANAQSARIEPEVGDIPSGELQSGCRTVRPSQSTIYRLTVTGTDGRQLTMTASLSLESVRPVPVLLSPEDGAVMDNGCERRRGIAWEFRWSEVPGATQYQIIARHAPTQTVLVDATIFSTSHRYESRSHILERFLSGWQWRVRAQVGGAWQEWSPERSFRVKPVNTDCP